MAPFATYRNITVKSPQECGFLGKWNANEKYLHVSQQETSISEYRIWHRAYRSITVSQGVDVWTDINLCTFKVHLLSRHVPCWKAISPLSFYAIVLEKSDGHVIIWIKTEIAPSNMKWHDFLFTAIKSKLEIDRAALSLDLFIYLFI